MWIYLKQWTNWAIFIIYVKNITGELEKGSCKMVNKIKLLHCSPLWQNYLALLSQTNTLQLYGEDLPCQPSKLLSVHSLLATPWSICTFQKALAMKLKTPHTSISPVPFTIFKLNRFQSMFGRPYLQWNGITVWCSYECHTVWTKRPIALHITFKLETTALRWILRRHLAWKTK